MLLLVETRPGPLFRTRMTTCCCSLARQAEAVNLASDRQTLRISRATLSTMGSWDNANSFCWVYSQAARVGMPLSQWLPQLRANLEAGAMGNGVVASFGAEATAEVVGALQALADIMLQSVTPTDGSGISWALLFPITARPSLIPALRMHFTRAGTEWRR